MNQLDITGIINNIPTEVTVDSFINLFKEEFTELKSTLAKFNEKRMLMQKLMKSKYPSESLILDLNINQSEFQKLYSDPFIDFMNKEAKELENFINEKRSKFHLQLLYRKAKQQKLNEASVNISVDNFKPNINSTEAGIPYEIDENQNLFLQEVEEEIENDRNEENCKIVKCSMDGKIFYSQDEFLRHFREKHTKRQVFECQKCKEKFSSKPNLVKHLKIHEEPEEDFKCEICDKTFGYRGSFKRHLKTHDMDRQKQYKCQHCDYETEYKQRLTIHLLVHKEVRIKSFKCQQCDFRTDRNEYLKIHNRKHDPEFEKVQCPHCPFKTLYKQNLYVHIKIKHN